MPKRAIRDRARSWLFNDTATTEIYALSLHDALPICLARFNVSPKDGRFFCGVPTTMAAAVLALGVLIELPVPGGDRKSTRLNSSHANISYAVFCLKKTKKT